MIDFGTTEPFLTGLSLVVPGNHAYLGEHRLFIHALHKQAEDRMDGCFNISTSPANDITVTAKSPAYAKAMFQFARDWNLIPNHLVIAVDLWPQELTRSPVLWYDLALILTDWYKQHRRRTDIHPGQENDKLQRREFGKHTSYDYAILEGQLIRQNGGEAHHRVRFIIGLRRNLAADAFTLLTRNSHYATFGAILKKLYSHNILSHQDFNTPLTFPVTDMRFFAKNDQAKMTEEALLDYLKGKPALYTLQYLQRTTNNPESFRKQLMFLAQAFQAEVLHRQIVDEKRKNS